MGTQAVPTILVNLGVYLCTRNYTKTLAVASVVDCVVTDPQGQATVIYVEKLIRQATDMYPCIPLSRVPRVTLTNFKFS